MMMMLSHMLAIVVVVVGVVVMLPVGECGETAVGGCKVTRGATVSWYTSVPQCLAASEDGDVVTVNSQFFYTQEAWVITKNITLQGSGGTRSFSKYPGKARSEIAFTSLLTSDGNTSKDLAWMKITAKDVFLKDLYINTQTMPISAGVDVSNVNLVIQNCEIVGRKDKLIIKDDPVDDTSSSPYSLTITDSAFTNIEYGPNGGVMTMTLHRSSVTISGTTLSGGGGDSAGGCLYIKTSGRTSPTSVSLTNTTLTNCYAMEKQLTTGLEGGKGGGAYLDLQNAHPDSSFIISSSSFIDNKANGIGGGLYLENAPSALAAFSLDTVTFSGNIAAMGGGVGVSGTAMTPLQTDSPKNITFTGNSAHSHGGGIYISPSLTTPRVYNCPWVFTDNTAGDFRVKLWLVSKESKMRFGAVTGEEKGGAIYVASSSSSTTDASMTTITFLHGTMTGNKASLGGAIAADSPVTINNIKTSANVAYYGGGALYFNSDAVVQQGCSLYSDSVTQSDHTTAPVVPQSGNGGAINIQSGTVELKGCSISDTSAYNDGGVLYIAAGRAKISGSTMKEATAGGDGGCLAIHGGDVELTSSYIKYNTASNNGGGVSMTSNSTSSLKIESSAIVQNWAVGGIAPAFYIHSSSPPSISIRNSLFYGNKHEGSAAIVLYAVEGESYTWSSYRSGYEKNDGGHIEMRKDDDIDDTTGTFIAMITKRDQYDPSPLDNDNYSIKISSVTADITFQSAFFDGGCVNIFSQKAVIPNVVADYYDAKDGNPAGVRYLKAGWYGAYLDFPHFTPYTCDKRYLTHSSTHFPGTPEDICDVTVKCRLPGDPADGEYAYTNRLRSWPSGTKDLVTTTTTTTTTTPPSTSSTTTTRAPVLDKCRISEVRWWEARTFLGWPGVTEASCLAKGFCWNDPSVVLDHGDKWKCYPQAVGAGYLPGSTCYVHAQDRIDAGWPGISFDSCKTDKGACWDHKARGVIQCYWPTNKQGLDVYE